MQSQLRPAWAVNGSPRSIFRGNHVKIIAQIKVSHEPAEHVFSMDTRGRYAAPGTKGETGLLKREINRRDRKVGFFKSAIKMVPLGPLP